MRSDLTCLVRVLGGTSPDDLAFLGTGMLVESALVLTCRHVVRKDNPWDPSDRMILPHLLVESVTGQQVVVRPEVIVGEAEDLALLTLAAPLPGDVPPFLYGLTKTLVPTLQRAPLEVFGFTANDKLIPRQYDITGLLTLYTYQEGTLLDFQLHGGLQEGVSGSPVLVGLGDQWAYVGIAYLGGERSASSRVIMADPVVRFLTQQAGLLELKRIDATRALAFSRGGPASFKQLIEGLERGHDLPIPYRHLEAFREIDAPYFYGRHVDTQSLVETLQQYPRLPFVALVGASGSGKSSLVQAGVVPVLRRDPRWQVAVFRPGRDPFGELAMVLVPLLAPELTKRSVNSTKLADMLRNGDMSVAEVAALLEQTNPAKRLLLIVDQFEEIYTQPLREETRNHFLDWLLTLPQGQRPCTVFVALRADFLNQMLDFEPLRTALNTYPPHFLGSMSEIELQDAIEQPARQFGVELEPRLVDRLLQDLKQAPGSLPLLQFALAELWTQRSQMRLTHTAYDAIGGVQHALARHADSVLAKFVAQERQRHLIVPLGEAGKGIEDIQQIATHAPERLRRVFTQLVRPGEGTEDTRQVATRAQVGEDNWPLVQQLADARLVVTGWNEERKQETVEVVHEALIRHWPPIQQWMEQARQFRVWQNRLRHDIQDWRHSNCDEGALLQGTRLAEAEAKLAQHKEDLTLEEQTYIEESVRHHNQARREQEQLKQGEDFRQLLVKVGIWAGLIGGLTRVMICLFLESFLWVNVSGTISWDAFIKPFWHGWLGTVVGGLFVVMALEAKTLQRQGMWLVIGGFCWGGFVYAIVSQILHPENLEKISWQNVGWGYLITGPCWGVGLAVGMYIGTILDNNSSDFLIAWRRKLLGAAWGAFCFLLLSPLLMNFFFEPQMQDRSLGLWHRTWGEVFEQTLSAWAVLGCYYWHQRSRARQHL